MTAVEADGTRFKNDQLSVEQILYLIVKKMITFTFENSNMSVYIEMTNCGRKATTLLVTSSIYYRLISSTFTSQSQLVSARAGDC